MTMEPKLLHGRNTTGLAENRSKAVWTREEAGILFNVACQIWDLPSTSQDFVDAYNTRVKEELPERKIRSKGAIYIYLKILFDLDMIKISHAFWSRMRDELTSEAREREAAKAATKKTTQPLLPKLSVVPKAKSSEEDERAILMEMFRSGELSIDEFRKNLSAIKRES